MRAFLPLALAAVLLGACATTPTTHMTEGKALADAWSAFDAASVTLDGLAQSGALSASERSTIKAIGPQVEASLSAATIAYDANNDATAQQNVAEATTLIAQLVAIAGAHK